MKQYLVFVGDCYYPGGGWNDFDYATDSLDDAILHAGQRAEDWRQVVDLEQLAVVWPEWKK